MLQRCWIGAVLVLAAGALPAHGEVTLEWKFKKGDKFYLETNNILNQSMKARGKDLKAPVTELRQDVEVGFLFSVTVQEVNADKSYAVLEETIEQVVVRNAGGPTGQIPAEDKFNQQLKGATFRLTVTPHGEVTKFDGYDDLVKKLAGEDAVAQKTVRAVFSEEYLKRSATDVFGVLPPGPVKGADEWGGDKKRDVPLGPLGGFTTTRTYKYESKDTLDGKPFDKITFKGTATYNPPKSGEGGPFPFQVTKADLKVEDLKGTVWFDDAAGRLAMMEASVRVKGTMTAVVSGNTIDSELDQTWTTRMRVLDKPPERPSAPQ